MSTQNESFQIKVAKSLMHYSYNYREQKEIEIDILLARWPGGYLFEKYISKMGFYLSVSDWAASLAGRSIRPKLEKRAFSKIDHICSSLARDILKNRNILTIINKIESKALSFLENYRYPEQGSSRQSYFWFDYLKESATSLISGSLESIRSMDNDSEEKKALVRLICQKIKHRLPVEYAEQFGDDIDDLVKEYFFNPDCSYHLLKAKLASRISQKLHPKLAEAIKPIVKRGIPHIAGIGETIIRENTKSLHDWIWSQTSSCASSFCFFTALFSTFSSFSALSLLFTTILANLGVLWYEFMQTQTKKIDLPMVMQSLKENYSDDFKNAIAGCFADIHNDYLGGSKTADDFLEGVSEELVDGAISVFGRKTVKLMKLENPQAPARPRNPSGA